MKHKKILTRILAFYILLSIIIIFIEAERTPIISQLNSKILFTLLSVSIPTFFFLLAWNIEEFLIFAHRFTFLKYQKKDKIIKVLKYFFYLTSIIFSVIIIVVAYMLIFKGEYYG